MRQVSWAVLIDIFAKKQDDRIDTSKYMNSLKRDDLEISLEIQFIFWDEDDRTPSFVRFFIASPVTKMTSWQ